MKEQEKYWRYKSASPTPDHADIPIGTFSGDKHSWEQLTPGFRRTILREAIISEAKSRGLPEETISRIKIATISGGLSSLDEYLDAFQMEDERRAPLREDADRLARADDMHKHSEVQILAREDL